MEIPSIQSCRNCRLRSGMNLLCSESSDNRSRMWVCLTYHSFSRIISTGFPPRSLTGTSCMCFSAADKRPDSRSISIEAFLASSADIPENGPLMLVIRPFISTATNGLRANSRNTATSFWSPNEQTIRTPLPNSIFTEGWVTISTDGSLSSTGRGRWMRLPTRWVYRSSSGCTTTTPQAQIISGRVVDIITSSPSSVVQRTSHSRVSRVIR